MFVWDLLFRNRSFVSKFRKYNTFYHKQTIQKPHKDSSPVVEADLHALGVGVAGGGVEVDDGLLALLAAGPGHHHHLVHGAGRRVLQEKAGLRRGLLVWRNKYE